MKRMIRKAAALLLCVSLLSFLPLSAATAASGLVAVYVPDLTQITLWQDAGTEKEKELFSPDSQSSVMAVANLFLGLLMAEDNPASGLARVNGAIDTLMKPIALTAEGTPEAENTGARSFVAPLSTLRDTEIYTANLTALAKANQNLLNANELYVFNYDWRLDPRENADLLMDYIDYVLEYSGRSRVALLAGGSGGAVVNAYCYLHYDHTVSKVANCVYLDSAACGSTLIGDLMSGDLVRTLATERGGTDGYFDVGDVLDTLTGEDLGAAVARYIGDDPGGLVEAGFTALLGNSSSTSFAASLALQLAALIIDSNRLFAKLGNGYKRIALQAEAQIYGQGLSEYLRNMPGLWALVPAEKYEKAVNFLFGGFSNIPKTLLDKITAYRAVMENTPRTVATVRAYGVGVNAVAGYNRQILPLTASINTQSDGIQATKLSSFGATAADATRQLTAVSKCSQGHSHMEQNLTIDAGTCLLPENTWFIKNHSFLKFDDAGTAQFLVWLLMADAQRTIWQNDSCPQYLVYSVSEKTLSPYHASGSPDTLPYRYGDMNMDGTVDAGDARLALRGSVGLEGKPSALTVQIGDVDGDGTLTAMDARLILRFSVNLIASFPVQTRA